MIRSVCLSGSQRDIYRDFEMQLFKIDCEISFSKELGCERISEIKEKLYCLRKDFDVARMKAKYEMEFRFKYRRVMENLEIKSLLKKTEQIKRKSRKKCVAPLPPTDKEIVDLQNEINKFREIVCSFHGRRDSDKHRKLHQRILSLLFKLTSLETGSDIQKYNMVKELLQMLKQLEDKAMKNDELSVNSD